MLGDRSVKDFKHLLQLLRGRHLLQDRTAVKEILSVWMSSAQHGVLRLRHHPLVFKDLAVFVAQVQCTL